MNDSKHVMHFCPGPKCRKRQPGRTWPTEETEDGRRVQKFECAVCSTVVNVHFDDGDFQDSYDEPDRQP